MSEQFIFRLTLKKDDSMVTVVKCEKHQIEQQLKQFNLYYGTTHKMDEIKVTKSN